MLKAILWDNDGVLVDTERLFFEANRALLAELGATLTAQGFVDNYLLSSRGSWDLLGTPTDAQIAQWRAERNRRYVRLLAQAGELAMPGMPELIPRLAARLRMGVVTSAWRDHFDLIHARLPLRQHFEFVISGEDCVEGKPHPEPYLRGLAKLGLSADECVVVEDAPRGLAAARAAGLRCIVLRHPLLADQPFDGALAVVDSAAELEDCLAGL